MPSFCHEKFSLIFKIKVITITKFRTETRFEEETDMNSDSHPGQSFSPSLCGPISISRANAHMVHMGYKTSTSHYTQIS